MYNLELKSWTDLHTAYAIETNETEPFKFIQKLCCAMSATILAEHKKHNQNFWF